jgi:3-deoxy-D-manno-octulosonic-acid transferase
MLYDLVFAIFSVFYLPYFVMKGKWRGFSRQRLGILPDAFLARVKDKRAIWLHAVSVGEVIASLPLYDEIRKNFPSEKIIVSTVTPPATT